MTEEEVAQEMAKMNQTIYINKLLKDLDQCYDLLTIIFNNVINVFNKEMDTRSYEITIMDEDSLSHEEISKRIQTFFDVLRKTINDNLVNNKEILKQYITNNEMEVYIEGIDDLSLELITTIEELYQNEAINMVNDLSLGLDEFSKKRLDKLIKEIIYKHFIERVNYTLDNNNRILLNNVNSNNLYLENMNKKTVNR